MNEFEDLDTSVLVEQLTELAKDTLANQVQYEEVEVIVSIPVQIKTIIEYISSSTGTELEQLYSKLCSVNISDKISSMTSNENTNSSEKQIHEDIKIDGLENLHKKMDEFQGIVSQFERMRSSLDSLEQIAEVFKEKNEKE